MPRRVFVPQLTNGSLLLPESEAHHLRNVLRARVHETIELFDNAGNIARASITEIAPSGITVQVEEIHPATAQAGVTIAAALPKGDRADWMIEKLSELAVDRFIPLQTERSVVHPEGKNKLQRWTRIATEAAKQSHRPGVMQIDALTPLPQLVAALSPALYLSPEPDAPALTAVLSPSSPTCLLIGPEGGWAPDELDLFHKHRLPPARLATTILRIETAAVAAAAIAACASLRPAGS